MFPQRGLLVAGNFSIFALDPEKTKPSYPTFLETIHPDDRPLANRRLIPQSMRKEIGNWDYRIVLPALSIKHVQAEGHPFVNEYG